jgi:hypothetical protein
MRYIIFCFACCLIFSCKKEGNLASTAVLNEMVDTSSLTKLKYSGSFSSGPFGTVSGKAEVYQTSSGYQVKLADFNTNNGPALHVYISKEAMPVNFIDLGVLKSIAGNQLYPVAGMPDFGSFIFISIHCVAYNHLFGYAQLK